MITLSIWMLKIEGSDDVGGEVDMMRIILHEISFSLSKYLKTSP